MRENLAGITLKNTPEKRILSDIDAFTKKKRQLVGNGFGNFRVSDSSTLEVNTRLNISTPDLRLRNNEPVIDVRGRLAYTHTDVKINRFGNEVLIEKNALILHPDAVFADWSSKNVSKNAAFDSITRKMEDVETKKYRENFNEILIDVGQKDLDEIIEIFNTISYTDKIDEYGRKPEEAARDEILNESIEKVAESILINAELHELTVNVSEESFSARGITDSDERIILWETTDKKNLYIQVEPTLYWDDSKSNEADIFILSKEEKRLKLHKPYINPGSQSEVIYPARAHFDILASEEQAKNLLKKLQTLDIFPD